MELNEKNLRKMYKERLITIATDGANDRENGHLKYENVLCYRVSEILDHLKILGYVTEQEAPLICMDFLSIFTIKKEFIQRELTNFKEQLNYYL